MIKDLPASAGARVAAWIERFVVVPKGEGAQQPIVLQSVQLPRDLAANIESTKSGAPQRCVPGLHRSPRRWTAQAASRAVAMRLTVSARLPHP